jgi:hypothetical protein
MADAGLRSRARALRLVSAFRAFQHLYTVEDQLACLACIRRVLAPGGRWRSTSSRPILARIAQREEPEHEEGRFPTGDEIVRVASVRRDHATQTQHVTMRLERWRDGALVGAEIERFGMRWYHRYDRAPAARAGFEIVALHGGFDRRAYDEDSIEMVVVARLRSDGDA